MTQRPTHITRTRWAQKRRDRRPAAVVPNDDQVTIAVTDTKNGETFEVPIREGERALEVFRHPLEVFRHPYAYAARPQHRCVPIAVSHSS